MANPISLDRVKSDPTSAELYTKRKSRKHLGEMQMLAKANASLPSSSVRKFLDAPCGVGRATAWLSSLGYRVHGIDLGESAVTYTRNLLREEGVEATVENQNIFDLDYEDGEFDATLCFRLIHHFNEEKTRAALIAELCRVSSQFVLLSYISPYSVTSIKRKIRHMLTGKPIKQNATTLKEIESHFGDNGFASFYRVKRSQILHSLQLVVFRRENI